VVAGRLALVGLVALLLQLTVISPITVAGARPDVVLLFAIVVSMETDPERGAVAGFALGLAFDLLLDTPAGLTALTLTLVGWGVGTAKDAVLRSSRVISLALVAVASMAGTLLYAGLAVVFGVTIEAGDLPAIVGLVAVVNALLSQPLRWVVRRSLGPERRSPSRDRSVFRP